LPASGALEQKLARLVIGQQALRKFC